MTRDSEQKDRGAYTKALLEETSQWEQQLMEMVGRLKAFTDILNETGGPNDATAPVS